MNADQFWLRAADIYNLYHDKYRRAVLTDEEIRETVTDFNNDIVTLIGEWLGSQEQGKDG